MTTENKVELRERLIEKLRATIKEEGGELTETIERQIAQIATNVAHEPQSLVEPLEVADNSRQNRRVVITGMGVISPVGIGKEAYWESLVNGRSGIDTITMCDTEGCTTKIAGEVKNWNPEEYIDPKQVRRMSRASQFAVGAAKQAVQDAELCFEEQNPRIGVLLGTGTSSFPDTEAAAQTLFTRGPMRISPFFAPISLANAPAGQVAMTFKAHGYNGTIVTACAAGTQAIGEAFEVIRRGEADVMLAGGTEAPICRLGLAAFCVMRVMSTRNEEPQKASRPFDKNRDGFVPAEGAAILVLESLEHALQRGAKIYAEIVGYGATSDAYHMVMPEPDGTGAARAMRKALECAHLSPDQIDYINGHGTSTQLNDAAETLAIKAVFGEYAYKVPISSTKSMTGHLLGAAGAIEAVASVMTIYDKVIPPTINYETPDPACDLDYVPNEARRADVRTVMSNSFGFGGQNAVLIFREYQG